MNGRTAKLLARYANLLAKEKFKKERPDVPITARPSDKMVAQGKAGLKRWWNQLPAHVKARARRRIQHHLVERS